MTARNARPNPPRSSSVDRPRKPTTAKRGPYVSDTILQRRRRIIQTARAMIAEGAAGGFTVRELARRARVSVAVVYSTYGDKEGLMAAAIDDFYRALPLAQRPAPSTLTDVLHEVDETMTIVRNNAAYSRALCELYFSPTADARVFQAIQNIAVEMVRPWLQRCMAEGQTVPGLALEDMYAILARDRWSMLQAWSRGRIADAQIADAQRVSFLALAAGLTTGDERTAADAALRKVAQRLDARRTRS